MNALYNALDADKFSRIKICKWAQEIWKKLSEIHEATHDVKKQNKTLLVTEYESFKVKSRKNIDKIYCRFTSIIKYLKILKKKILHQRTLLKE